MRNFTWLHVEENFQWLFLLSLHFIYLYVHTIKVNNSMKTNDEISGTGLDFMQKRTKIIKAILEFCQIDMIMDENQRNIPT